MTAVPGGLVFGVLVAAVVGSEAALAAALAATLVYGLLGAACAVVLRGALAGVVALLAYGLLGELVLAPQWAPAAGRFEVTVGDPEAALSALRALRLICWRDNGKVLVETGAPYQVGRPDGSAIARALAAAGIYPSDLRRSPTLELAYAEVTSGLAPDPRPPAGHEASLAAPGPAAAGAPW